MKAPSLNSLEKWVTALVLMLVLSMTLPTGTQSTYPGRDLDQIHYSEHFRIKYTNDPADYPHNCTDAEVEAFGRMLDSLWEKYDACGFKLPRYSIRVEIYYEWAWPFNAAAGELGNTLGFSPYYLGSRWLPMQPEGTTRWVEIDDTEPIAIAAHEFFHLIQHLYAGGDHHEWIKEGTAQAMQDKVNSEVDLEPVEFSGYHWECSQFLRWPHLGLMEGDKPRMYEKALFWNYLMEQYGGKTLYFCAEPQRGVDFMRELWEQLDAVPDYGGIDTINRALAALGHSDTFEDAFRNFIVANYVKDLTGVVPSKYRYIDETQPPGSYDWDHDPSTPPVFVCWDGELGPHESHSETHDVHPWAARYYRMRPSPDAVAINVQVTQTSNRLLSYHMLLIDGGNLVQEYRLKAKDFAKSIVNLDYDEVVLVVGGLDQSAQYSCSFTTATYDELSLNILSPLESPAGARARVGSHEAPEKLLSMVEVTLEGSPINGLSGADFSASVGGETATIETSAYVLGLYLLLIQAPNQKAAGLYDLSVRLEPGFVTGVEDVENNAVEYNGLVADNVLVIDKSGSMRLPLQGSSYTEGKINAAKLAAKLYVDSFLDADKIGVVAFNETASLEMDLQDITTTARIVAKNQIDGITADGTTSIGGGLLMGYDQLYSFGDTGHSWVIILLSDGRENEDPRVEDVLPKVLGRGITVHTVAIGADADEELLMNLAYATPGGTFHFAHEPASGDLSNDLADIYRSIAEDVNHQQRILAFRGSGASWDEKVPVDKEAKEAFFVFSFNATNTNLSPVTELRDPDSTQVPPTFWDYKATPNGVLGYTVWRVEDPKPGDWRVLGEGTAGNFLIEAAVRHELTMKLIFPEAIVPQGTETVTGEPVSILTSLAHEGPVVGADVSVYITTPKSSQAPSVTHLMRLFDDGAHGDGSADDGIYGNFYTRTSQNGTYIVKAVATGSSPLMGDFRREVTGAFYIEADKDSDMDGMSDTWEKQHGLDPHESECHDGANGDPDRDGLSNIEEYRHGTDPMNSDTDRGGESDGSEVEFGRDPTDPKDDTITPPTTIFVVPGNYTNTIYFSLTQEYHHLVLCRSEQAEEAYKVIEPNVPPIGFYNDTNVENGIKYYYKIAAVNKDGTVSAFTWWASGTPKKDTEPPNGYLLINYGVKTTPTPDVVLTLMSSEDTTEMMVSNDPRFEGAKWESYVTEKRWTLGGTEGVQWVYVLFRDEAGNVADALAFDTITIVPAIDEDGALDTDGDGTPDTIDSDDDDDGMPDTWETENGLNPLDAADASLDPDGDGLTNLEEYEGDTDPNVSDAQVLPWWILGVVAVVVLVVVAALVIWKRRKPKITAT